MKITECGRGHDLRVPYACFTNIAWIGPDAQSIQQEFAAYADWAATRSDGRSKPEGVYLCAECMLELLEIMERWREGDSELMELVKKWKRDNGPNEYPS